MTPQAQRIEIAKACGWTQVPDAYYHDRVAWTKGEQRFGTCDLPYYLSDLNAMHDAEKRLAPGGQWTYIETLREVLAPTVGLPVCDCERVSDFFVACATAAHRAEAFLRNLILWDDSK